MVDRRDPAWPVRDQGQRGTCVAFAGTAAHEALRGHDNELSEEFLHWAAKARDGLPRGSDGTSLEAMAESLADAGQSTASLWAYDSLADDAAADYGPSPEAIVDGADRRLDPCQFIATSPDEIIRALDESSLPVVGVVLFETWHGTESDGRIELPDQSMVPLGGHAVTVVGSRGRGEGVELVIRNSWGADWGDDGYGYLPADYLERYGLVAVRLTPPDEGIDG